MKKLLCILLLCPALVLADEGMALDQAPDVSNDNAALQRGAKLFVNYCLNCHSASLMRYNRLKDIGLSDDQIKDNLLFTGEKVGDMMKVALQPKDGKAFFGAAPPDLSVMARAKSPDYIYTYLRTYYVDPARPTGWNNLAYPGSAMPHILWQLQGKRAAEFVTEENPEDKSEKTEVFSKFVQLTPGSMSSAEYDSAVADLTGFMTYMAEPAKATRQRVGLFVMLFLMVFFVITWRLNASFWKDVH
jgi:ubiquinol-cytochrome c reductase cytochrome c1 subunit